jgi:hypothetical protein
MVVSLLPLSGKGQHYTKTDGMVRKGSNLVQGRLIVHLQKSFESDSSALPEQD